MCSSGSNKKTQTQTQNQTSTTRPADQETIDAYKRLIAGSETTAGQAWNPATSQQVAGFTPDQQAAFSQIRGGIASPYIDEAAGYARAGAGDISGNIENYYNPYVDQVVDATQRDFDVQNQRQQSGVVGDARMRGSLGGDREAVAQALTAEAQSRVQSPIMANLRSQGYNTALSAAQNEAARSLQTSGIMGNLGQLAYTDTSALLGIGGQQQQNQQGILDAASANAQAQSAYPFQTQQWLAGILGSATPNLGSTTNSSGTSTGTGTGGSPNTWSQAIGAGIALAGLLARGGRVPHRAAGGGIGYVPQFDLNQGRSGLQPSAPIQMGSMSMGGGEKEKGFADHWREINATAKGVKDAAGGISKGADSLGKYLNSSTGPGGWNTTVDYGSPMANLSSGLGNSMSGFSDAMSGLSSSIAGLFSLATGGAVQRRAAGGGVDDNDPAGSYDAWQDPGPRGLNDPAGLYDAGPTPPSAPMPALVDLARERASNPLPPNMLLMPQGHDLPPMTDVPVRQQSIGAPPGAGTVYAAPPPPPMGQGPLNPSGSAFVPAMPPAAPAPQQGIGERTWSWLRSDEGRDALMRAGAAMMIGSREGGKGTLGIHLGQGLQAGIEGASASRKSAREQQIETAKLDLANRAQQLRESENTRAEALHPYQIGQLKQQTETQRAAAEVAKIIQVDPNRRIFDARTGQWITPPDTGADQYADIAAKEYAKDTPKLLTESIKTADESRGIVRTIDEMKSLSENMYTGALADQRLAAAKVARLLGLDFDATRIANSEQFRAKMQDFVLAAASKLKPLSNADIEFVQKGLPDLARDPTAIAPMLDSLRRVAERNALIESYRQQYYARGRRPDNAAIEDRVNKEIPPPGGASSAASPPAPASSSISPGNSAQPTSGQSQSLPQTSEAERQKLLAAPDGLVQYKGQVYMKQGNRMTPAPENSYRRGFFGSLGDLDGNRIPSIQ